MDIKTFLEGGKFSEFQHIVILSRDAGGIFSRGGGSPSSVISRFGDKEIKFSSVYETMLRIEV